MEKIRNYKILPDERIIIEYCKGKVSWIEYMEMKKIQMTEPDYDGTYNVVSDIRDVDTDFTAEIENEIRKYVEYLKSQKKTIKHKTSIITHTPKQLLHAEFFKMYGNHVPIFVKTVSTYESAFFFVELNEDKHQKIEEIFHELKV